MSHPAHPAGLVNTYINCKYIYLSTFYIHIYIHTTFICTHSLFKYTNTQSIYTSTFLGYLNDKALILFNLWLGEDNGIHTFPKGISLKVSIIAVNRVWTHSLQFKTLVIMQQRLPYMECIYIYLCIYIHTHTILT